MLTAAGKALGEEATLCHAQQLKGVAAHLSLKLTNLGHRCCCYHPP